MLLISNRLFMPRILFGGILLRTFCPLLSSGTPLGGLPFSGGLLGRCSGNSFVMPSLPLCGTLFGILSIQVLRHRSRCRGFRLGWVNCL